MHVNEHLNINIKSTPDQWLWGVWLWKIKRWQIRRLQVFLHRSSGMFDYDKDSLPRCWYHRLALLTCCYPTDLSCTTSADNPTTCGPSPRSKVAHSRITFTPMPSLFQESVTTSRALGSRAKSSYSSYSGCSSAASSAKCDFLKPPSKTAMAQSDLNPTVCFTHSKIIDDTWTVHTKASLYNIYKKRTWRLLVPSKVTSLRSLRSPRTVHPPAPPHALLPHRH